MKIEFDPVKSEKNARERGLPFELVEGFDWGTSYSEEDKRFPTPSNGGLRPGFSATGCMSSAIRRSRAEPASSVFARPIVVRFGNMKKRKPLTDKDGEVRELTAEDFAAMRPTAEVLPELVALWRKRGQRGPQKAPTKQQVTLRLDKMSSNASARRATVGRSGSTKRFAERGWDRHQRQGRVRMESAEAR